MSKNGFQIGSRTHIDEAVKRIKSSYNHRIFKERGSIYGISIARGKNKYFLKYENTIVVNSYFS